MQTKPRMDLARFIAVAVLAAALLPLAAQPVTQEAYEPQVGQSGKDVVWVPTPDDVVQKMLDMAQVKAGETVVDLGSGDGKIAIAAAKRGAKARGVEFNPKMVALSKRNAQDAGVNVEFVRGDIFKSDFSKADVITLYLLPELNERLRPRLLKMKPGTRVASHQFLMGDWEPDETASVGSRQAHLWHVPALVKGRWEVRIGDAAGPHIHLQQRYQKVEGAAEWGSSRRPLHDAKLIGSQLSFTLADAKGAAHRFAGTVERGRIRGMVVDAGSGEQRPFTAVRR